MKCSKLLSNTVFVLAILLCLLLLSQCEKNTTVEPGEQSSFNFPQIETINSNVYANIKETCNDRWDLNKMLADTFEIQKDKDEYSVQCDGHFGEELYHFVIRVDENGNWINDGRSLKNPL